MFNTLEHQFVKYSPITSSSSLYLPYLFEIFIMWLMKSLLDGKMFVKIAKKELSVTLWVSMVLIASLYPVF